MEAWKHVEEAVSDAGIPASRSQVTPPCQWLSSTPVPVPCLIHRKDGGNFAHPRAKSLSEGGGKAGAQHNLWPLRQQHGGSWSPAKVPAEARCPAGDVWSLLRGLSKTPSIPAGLRKPLLAHGTGSVGCSLRASGTRSAVVGRDRLWWEAVGLGGGSHLALMRYCARLMFAGVPVMVIWRSDDPSVAFAILICAPDICRISLILVPWRPIMQPISWEEKHGGNV